MDGLTWFGLVAVSLMLISYALEDRSARYILAFAGACACRALGLSAWLRLCGRAWRRRIGKNARARA
jgi:hypothetical protein